MLRRLPGLLSVQARSLTAAISCHVMSEQKPFQQSLSGAYRPEYPWKKAKKAMIFRKIISLGRRDAEV